MKKFKTKFFTVIFILAVFSVAAISVQAQDAPLPAQPLARQNRNDRRPSLMQQLNLTPEQIQSIRNINLETREEMRRAVQRQRQARRALDQAIYAETANETVVRQAANQLAEAQSELTKLRARVEFRIRQVLTPEQLVRFRELRQQFNNSEKPRRRKMFPTDRSNRSLPIRHPQ